MIFKTTHVQCPTSHDVYQYKIELLALYMGNNYPLFPVPSSIIFIFAMQGWILPIYLVWRARGGRKDGGKTVKATAHAFLWSEFDFGAALDRYMVWTLWRGAASW
jgi:hypothetical protein